MSARVLISDQLSDVAVEIFKQRGIGADIRTGLSREELEKIIGDYDGLAIRSSTKVTPGLLQKAKKLKVIGRAGIGVDNVDMASATARGIIVMNTPYGNSITTAEHAIAMMFALARQLPEADTSTRAGKWEKSRFIGMELTAKTLGIIGCGNIGGIVAERAIGLKMRVVAFDPYLSAERALELGVEKVELDELLKRANIITLHTPLTEQTKHILNAKTLAKCKKGVRVINCARGGLIDEVALLDALKSGQAAGAALDVFAEEPARQNPLFLLPNVICTPHLGASTLEAQENVALQIADQMAEYLLRGAIINAVNFPSITAEEAPRLKPFIDLAEKLGSLLGQLTEAPIKSIRIEYEGGLSGMNTRALTSAALTGVLAPMHEGINMVSAPVVAKQAGIVIEEVTREARGQHESLLRITVAAEDMPRHAAGTVFHDNRPRIVEIRSIAMDAEFSPHMLFVRNADKPGFIGAFGTLLGEAKVNIATFNLGRDRPGGDAISLVAVDEAVSKELLQKIEGLPQVKRARKLSFSAR
jgi:D-3-phosphoglycerate dehydrogenase